MAEMSPSDTTRPNPDVMNGVNAVPMASSRTPATNTPVGPWRSATAPATGWIAPHTNCPTASARLIVVMPSAVELLSGETNSPIDCRAPWVTIRTAAAASVTSHAVRAPPGVEAGAMASFYS